jgi:CubicO group peptidase (beta-lactamase class C family)
MSGLMSVLVAALLGLALGAAAPPAAAQVSEQAAGRVAMALGRSGFVGEILVADKERVRLATVAGGGRPGTRWRWASVSKQVAAALALRQVQAGRLGLDDPVARHLPDVPAAAAHPAVTVRHLLMHTSGLPNPEVAALPADPLPTCLGKAVMPPGERFEYRNCDTLVLAAVLSRVAGKPYAELLRDELTAAIGAHGITLATTPPELAAYGAAGAITGSALELLAFDRALMAQRWLSPEHTRTLWRGEPKLGYVALGAWAYPATLPGCAAPVEVVERRGAVPGVQVRNLLVPARGVAVIVFTPSERFEFGQVWQGRGFTHDLLSAALCD